MSACLSWVGQRKRLRGWGGGVIREGEVGQRTPGCLPVCLGLDKERG